MTDDKNDIEFEGGFKWQGDFLKNKKGETKMCQRCKKNPATHIYSPTISEILGHSFKKSMSITKAQESLNLFFCDDCVWEIKL